MKNRGEIVGSTRKIIPQKHTGSARRGPIRSPLLRGGGKAFGPRRERNPLQRMPQRMRHKAICSCLSWKAKAGGILGLTNYPDAIKTKTMATLLTKLPVTPGRPMLFVTPSVHKALLLSARNIPGMRIIQASYLNAEDILRAHHLIFLDGAIAKAEEVFGTTQKTQKIQKVQKKIRSSESSASPGSSTSS